MKRKWEREKENWNFSLFFYFLYFFFIMCVVLYEGKFCNCLIFQFSIYLFFFHMKFATPHLPSASALVFACNIVLPTGLARTNNKETFTMLCVFK